MGISGLNWQKKDYKIKTALGDLHIHLLKSGDEDLLLKFSDLIGNESRTLFSPYHWGTDKQISDYRCAIAKTLSGEDVSFVVLNSSNIPVALLNLWGVSREHLLNKKVLHIPTLGMCVADEHQNKGIGKICMKFLQNVATALGADAIELTTVTNNTRAIKLYLSCGFKDIGMLNIPLGVDPSTTDESELARAEWRKECHMVYIIKRDIEADIMNYLSKKQAKYNES